MVQAERYKCASSLSLDVSTPYCCLGDACLGIDISRRVVDWHRGAAEIRAHPHDKVAQCVLVALQSQSIARPVCVDLSTNDRVASCTFLSCMCCEHRPDTSCKRRCDAHTWLRITRAWVSVSTTFRSFLQASRKPLQARLDDGVQASHACSMPCGRLPCPAPEHHADVAWPVAESQQP